MNALSPRAVAAINRAKARKELQELRDQNRILRDAFIGATAELSRHDAGLAAHLRVKCRDSMAKVTS